MGVFNCAADYVRIHHPDNPVLAVRPHLAARAAQWFLQNFPGDVLYALKANDSPITVDALYNSGIRHFDVASIQEVEKLSSYEDVRLYLMNPVKSRETIRTSYYDFGVRDFALDSETELSKIQQETGNGKDLSLYVRLACNGDGSLISLDGKFGISVDQAPQLLMAVRQAACQLGISFHVGSQSTDPSAYARAMSVIETLIIRSGVLPDVIDVGGGFPSIYPGYEPPPLHQYVSLIEACFNRLPVVDTCRLICEPGRALVAESGSTIVRVEQRRGTSLYINDGAYGTLHDAAYFGLIYPSRRVEKKQAPIESVLPFSFYGPTCDSIDYMPGPYCLPADTGEGDYIEIGQLGAYGHVMHTRFNGFGKYEQVVLRDEPMMTMYSPVAASGIDDVIARDERT